jgi:predicted TIM-barrel fold metal-dependent hydrolase
MRIIDAHHHLWDLENYRYPWLAEPIDHPMGDYAPIRKSYLLQDFLADAEALKPLGMELVKSVHLQAEPVDPLAETAWLQSLADAPGSGGFPHAIVARVDFDAADIEAELERQAEYRNLRGIRYMLNYDEGKPVFCVVPRGDLMDDPAWRRGFGLLKKFDLSFDLQIWPEQMADAARLAAAFPDIQIILNHTGPPRARDETYHALWRDHMRLLAGCPNVAVKISGLGMADRNWTEASMRPFVLATIELFGVERCLFASIFRVDKLMSDYRTLWQAYDNISRDFSADERAALFQGNAARCYRI